MIRPGRHSRAKLLLFAALLVLGAAVVFSIGSNIAARKAARVRVGEWRSEMIANLSRAADFAQLRHATKNLGVFISRPDGTWIAIAYEDSHLGRITSCAVAVDSEGHWLESDYHFCGYFVSFTDAHHRLEALDSDIETDSQVRSDSIEALRTYFLYGAETAPTLADARAILERNHFVMAAGLPRPHLAGVATRPAATSASTSPPASR
jgi:hypothetical protein